MAKKFVRGITDVKTINNQDFDTNNVNDLLSDGQYNYIHRKKGKDEEYHNLTDNIKTISSDNTELLSVTNNNKTTNTATLHPKHDAQKEQVLESTRNTVTINHGTNGTAEKTTVDTNPLKVLEHSNLLSGSEYVTIEHEEESEISKIKTEKLKNDMTDLNNKIDGVERKIPTTCGGRNLAQGTSKDWSKPFTAFSGVEDTFPSLYKVLTDGLAVGDTIKTRIVLKYTDIVPASGKTARIRMQGSGNVTNWGSGGYNTSPWKTISGSGEVVIEHEFKITADHLKNDYWNLAFATNYIASGSLQWKLAKAERGMFFTDWSPAPEDVNVLIAQKQDVLTAGDGITIEGQTVDANPQKVLEHEKLKTGDGLTTSFNTDETTIMFKATKKPRETNLNTLDEGVIYGKGFSIDQVPGGDQEYSAAYVTINISENKKVQLYIREQTNDYGVIRLYYRFIINGEVTEWRKMPGDRSDLNYELAQKEQVLESQNNTITINHGTNGTDEKTTVNTNPEKVLEHENLLTDYGISKTKSGNTTKLGLEYTLVQNGYDLNNLLNGRVRGVNFLNGPKENTWYFVSSYTEGLFTIQDAITLTGTKNTTYRRLKTNNGWGAWREQVGDKSFIDAAINANTEKINQLTARLTVLEEKVAQLHPDS